jgi:hypothetical protein
VEYKRWVYVYASSSEGQPGQQVGSYRHPEVCREQCSILSATT